MPQSLVNNLIHLIYSTKNRRPLITREISEELCAYCGGLLKNLESAPVKIGCVEDHMHLLYSHSKNKKLKDVVKEVKRNSTNWLKNQGSGFQHFRWQRGYAAFSVSESKKSSVINYIDGQWDHHQRVSFKEEMREFFERHDVDYDEEYVWE